MPTVGETGERALIRRIRARLPADPDWLLVGIGDDAAVMVPERNRVEVVTTDVLVEAVHFDRRYVPPAAIGHRALAVNLSDLAAMGAEPRAALLSLILPADTIIADLDLLLDGMLELAGRTGVTLAGGNISRSSGPLVVDVTAIGSVKRRDVMLRRGARPGHDIYVSGSVGAARAGLLALSEGDAGPELDEARTRFLAPEPRLRLGQLLARNRVASACLDTSDGTADAVRQVARASRCGALVHGSLVPVPQAVSSALAAHGEADPLAAALNGGEDYELLFTVPPRRRRALAAVVRQAGGVPCTRIGSITAEGSLLLRRDGNDTPLPGGFAHF